MYFYNAMVICRKNNFFQTFYVNHISAIILPHFFFLKSIFLFFLRIFYFLYTKFVVL